MKFSFSNPLNKNILIWMQVTVTNYFHNLNKNNKSNFSRQQGGSVLAVRGGISVKRTMSLVSLFYERCDSNISNK